MLDALKTPEEIRAILQSVDPTLRQQVLDTKRYGWLPTQEEAFARLRRVGPFYRDPCSFWLTFSPEDDLTLKPEAARYLRRMAVANSEAVLRHWRAEQILQELNEKVLGGSGREHVSFDYRQDELNRRWDDKPPVNLPARVAHLEYRPEEGEDTFCLNFFALGWEKDMRGLQLQELQNRGNVVTIGEAIQSLPHPWQDFLGVAGRNPEDVCFLEMGLFLMRESDRLFPR